MRSPTRVFSNARVFTSKEGDSTLYDTLVTRRDKIVYVGDRAGAKEVLEVSCLRSVDADNESEEVEERDMGGKVILPGILDGHIHLLQLGNALGRVNCLRLSAAQIQAAFKARREAEPNAKMYLGASFLFDAIGQPPHRKILDEIIPDVPVFIDSMDLHSCWANTKGLEVLGITKDMPNPKGGEFQRDENGELTGLLMETAFHDYVWPWIADRTSLEEAIGQLDGAFKAFQSTGVTGAVDMAMLPDTLVALEEYYKRNGNKLPIRLSMHWLLNFAGTDADREARVREAAAHKERLKDKAPWMRMAGIKIISDGVVDCESIIITGRQKSTKR